MSDGFLYVPAGTQGPAARAEPGVDLRVDGLGPPWLVIDHDPMTVVVASWPGRLLGYGPRHPESPVGDGLMLIADALDGPAERFGGPGDGEAQALLEPWRSALVNLIAAAVGFGAGRLLAAADVDEMLHPWRASRFGVRA